MLNKILVPLDGSELAERALAFATGLSIPTAARLVLVRAVTTHILPGVDAREPQVRALAEAEIYLRGVAAGLTQRGLSSRSPPRTARLQLTGSSKKRACDRRI